MHRYRGYGNDNTAGGRLVARVDDDGNQAPLRHVVRHSPSGMSWGYAGSGPADLARSLLIDMLGDAAICGTCGGTGRERQAWDIDDVRCFPCSGEGWRELPYQRFKFDVIAGLPESWTLTSDEIGAWLDAHGAERGTPS